MTLGERLAHPWLTVRAQIALGLFFVVAALPKIGDPPSFAHMILNYRIVPGPFLNALALGMPWLELLSGLALILGIWRRAATAVIGALLVVFIVAIGINLVRGNPIDCGCFDVKAAGRSEEEQLADMRVVIARDLGMLLLVAQGLWATRAVRRKDVVIVPFPGDGA